MNQGGTAGLKANDGSEGDPDSFDSYPSLTDCEALWAVWKRLCAVCGRIREINEKRDSVKKRKPSVKESFILSQTVFFFWLQKPCSVVNALGWW